MYTTFITVFLSLLFTYNAEAQIPKFQLEGATTISHIHHHQCVLDDKSSHRECAMGFGIRLNYNLRPHWTLVGGYGIDNFIGQNKISNNARFFRMDLKFNFRFSELFPKLIFSAESGIEWYHHDKKIRIPFYLGLNQISKGNVDFFVRIRTPKTFLSPINPDFKLISLQVELGLTFNPKTIYLPKYQGTPLF